MTSAAACLIGLSAYREVTRWGAWHASADLLPANYADGIRAAGGLAVLLPAGAPDPVVQALAVMGRIDGLVLTGGADIDPRRYGQEPLPTTDEPRIDRDEWEIALVQAAIAAGRPILAICRGLQVLNVALGGTIVQHLPDVVGHNNHRGPVGTFIRHPVRVAEGTALAQIYGREVDTPTHHHQAVDRLADALTPTAWATDGTVEAATCEGEVWINAVQWHPEVEGGTSLFEAYVRACRQARQLRPDE